MATMNVGILTTAGKALFDRVESGQTKITYSKMVFSSMDNSSFSDEQLLGLTLITPQEVVINTPQTMLDGVTGETKIRGNGDNAALSSGVYIKTYGVYAKDDEGNEILYGLTVSDHPNYLAPFDGLTPQAVTYTYKTNISRTEQVNFTDSADVYLTEQDLKEATAVLVTQTNFNTAIDKKQDKLNYIPADDATVVHESDQVFKDKANFSDIKFVQLEAGTDLLKLVNNTERTQYYACDTDAKAKQMINCPAQNAFALITYPISTTTPVNSNSYPASNYVRLMLFRYDNSETWTANINTASGLPTSNGWVQISMGDTSLTAGIYRGDLDVHTANLDSIRKAGTYGYGGTKLSWIGGPQSIQGLDRWGSLEVFGVGDTWIQRMTTNAAETFVRQQSGSPATWGAWYQLAKMDMNNNISVHDVLNQGFGEWMSVTQKRIAGGYGNLVTCPKGTDFGAFVKGNSVPVGFSMVRDSNTNVNVAVYKESSLYGWAWYQGTADVVSHQAYWSNGAWSGWKTRNEYIRASNESDAVAKSKADPNNLYYWV